LIGKDAVLPNESRTVTDAGTGVGAGGIGVVTVKRLLLEPGVTAAEPGLLLVAVNCPL
jgi:hypothetical protein